VRKQSKSAPLPPEDLISDLEDAEAPLADRLDGEHYRDDVLRLLFICCHPDLPATQQIAVALRIVSGLSVKQIARAFLVGESAMEQRITRAKARIAAADVPFETPGAVERAERLNAVAAMVYLVFNEGYSAAAGRALTAARCATRPSAWRACCCGCSRRAGDHGPDGAAAAAARPRPGPVRRRGAVVLLEDQDRGLWNRG
jgi:RNA polymerase sigma-70 factor (ECF subfamily)